MAGAFIKPLIAALSSDDPNTQQSAAIALVTIGPLAATSLVEALGDADPDLQNASADVLFNIGEAAVEPLIAGLKHNSSSVRVRSAILLGKIQNRQAILFLVKSLSDWPVRSHAARALDTFHWKPKTSSDRIYYLIAKGRTDPLLSEWEPTKTFLRNKLLSGNEQLIEYGVNALVELGGAGIMSEMVDLLESRGNSTTAQTYYDSGHQQLMDAAISWAEAHGYQIVTDDEPPSPKN